LKTALLDVNVLLALTWSNHQHHVAAHHWFDEAESRPFATCSLTQLAFIRLSSNSSFTAEAVTPRGAASLLHKLCQDKGHKFWESPAADDAGLFQHTRGHQQVNDAWLVEVARQNNGQLATFDKRLAVHDPSGQIVIVIDE
jgi:toxin-antitoxin system PIN domain toxin